MNQVNHPNQSRQNGVPTASLMGPTRTAVNIVAMGSSRNDFLNAQLMEARPELFIGAELWTINYMGAVMNCDRIVHVDPVHDYTGHPVIKEMMDTAMKRGIPFYTSWPHPAYPNHVLYPFDKVQDALGTAYFNGTVAYTLALAMAEGFNEIGLFGCDFSYPDAHMSESGRACVEFLMGMGTVRGIKYAIGANSTLMDMNCNQLPYGFFKNPQIPPARGGALMTVPEIREHCRRWRNPVVRPLISAVPVAATAQAAPITPIEPEEGGKQPFEGGPGYQQLMPEHVAMHAAEVAGVRPSQAVIFDATKRAGVQPNFLGGFQMGSNGGSNGVPMTAAQFIEQAKAQGIRLTADPVPPETKPNGEIHASADIQLSGPTL